MDCPFELSIPAFPEPLRVASVRGRERVSGLFRFDVVVHLESGDPGPGDLLDQAARLTLSAGEEALRTVHGVVTHVEDTGRALRDRRTLRLSIGPRAHRARLSRRRRIFQEMTTAEIVAKVLGPHEVALRFQVARRLSARGYAVQYDESDWAFVKRLLAEEGLFFFFEHQAAAPAEVLVVADTPLDQAPIDGDPRLSFRRHAEGSAMVVEEDHVVSFTYKERLGPVSSHVQGYDFHRPEAPIEGRAEIAPGASEGRRIFEHEGPYEADPGGFSAETRLQQSRRRAARARGESACRRLAPGRTFTLGGHESAALDRAWAVTAVEHISYSSEALGQGRAARGEALYTSRFEAVPADRVLRPAWTDARPKQHAETAVVVGPAGREVYTDRHGRVKVQFHWDGEGQRDERSSAWLRVSQAWAGTGWGFQFVPRIGMEVVVTFLGGDPDRPLVTGCVVNATHPPPFPLPREETKSGVRTRTFGGTGFHELSFDDATGAEQVYLHSQRDYLEVIENHHTSEIRGSRKATVDGDAHDSVRGSERIEVTGARVTEIGGEERLVVKGDAAREHLKDDATTVHGAQKTLVHGAQVIEARGSRSVMIGTEDAPAHSDHSVYGSASTQATGHVVVRADKGLRLLCGDSRIDLLPDKIVLLTPTLEIAASETLSLTAKDGPSLSLAEGGVEILSKKVRIFSESGALELDKEAKVAGQKIKLGYDPSKPDKSKEDEEPETKPFKCRFTDYYLEPYAGKHYHLSVEGLRFEGDTDGDGNIQEKIPKEATQVLVRLWIDAYPEGRQQHYSLELKKEIPPVSSLAGGKLRLKNLGYYRGHVDELEDGELRAAIAEFQEDHAESHGLTPNGEYDEGTQGALEEIYGS